MIMKNAKQQFDSGCYERNIRLSPPIQMVLSQKKKVWM